MKGKLGWILFVVALIVIYWLAKCNGNGTKTELPKPPEVKTEPVQQAEVKSDEDSINNIVKPLEDELQQKDKSIARLENDRLEGEDRILWLQQQNDSLLSLLKPNEFTEVLANSAERLRRQINTNDSLCDISVLQYKKKSAIDELILKNERNKYKLLKKNFDSCTSGITEQKKYQDKIKTRNKVLIGATAGFNPTNKEFAYGLILQYSLKNGYAIQGSALQMKNSQMYSASILKTIQLKKR